MNNLKTTQSKEFFFDEAIKTGVAFDHTGGKHMVVAHRDKFMITVCDGVEHCFNKEGVQFENFPKLKLVRPYRVKVKLFTYIVYDKNSMEIISMHEGVMSVGYSTDFGKNPNIESVNITHPRSKQILENLGIGSTSWYI